MEAGAPTGLSRLFDWRGYQPRAAADARASPLGAALWRIDQDAAEERVFDTPSDTNIICVHLDGAINWSARYDERRYQGVAASTSLNMARAGERATIVYSAAHLTFVHFYLAQSVFRTYLEDVDRFELVDPRNAHDPVINRIGLQAMQAMQAGPSRHLRIEATGLLLAARMVDRWSTLSGRQRRAHAGGLAAWQLRRVCEHMLDQLGHEPSLAQLAAMIGRSPEHFCRAFQASTGDPPHRWLARRRLAAAHALLRDTALPISAVAARVGYDDPSYFARSFRKHTGMTPLAFRRGHAVRGRSGPGHSAPSD